jgi:hypothetical protein
VAWTFAKRKFLTREGERDEQEKVEGKEMRGVEGGYITDISQLRNNRK